MFKDIINNIQVGLNKPLPGKEAQLKMAPKGRIFDIKPTNPNVAGVLLLLYPVADKLHIVFIKRVTYPGVHSDQVAFPGGMKESTDKNGMEAAIREANEEVGAEPEKIRILGNLTPLYIPVSKILVEPYVGYSENKPDWEIDPKEVKYLIEEDLEILIDPSIIKEEEWIIENKPFTVPFYAVKGEKIWGATAMILSEFLEIVKRV